MSHIFCLVPEGKPIRGQWVLSLEYSLFYFGMPLRNANFYLACHKNKTAFARRAQRKDSFERPGNFCSVCLPGTVKKQRTDRGVVKTTLFATARYAFVRTSWRKRLRLSSSYRKAKNRAGLKSGFSILVYPDYTHTRYTLARGEWYNKTMNHHF